jgi:hypothetical protein
MGMNALIINDDFVWDHQSKKEECRRKPKYGEIEPSAQANCVPSQRTVDEKEYHKEHINHWLYAVDGRCAYFLWFVTEVIQPSKGPGDGEHDRNNRRQRQKWYNPNDTERKSCLWIDHSG